MRKLIPLLLVVMLVAGCASTPRERYSQVQDTYITAVQTLIDAKQADVFTDQEWDEDILPAIELGNDLLDEYGAATRLDQPTDNLHQRLQNVLSTLRPYIVEATTDGKEE